MEGINNREEDDKIVQISVSDTEKDMTKSFKFLSIKKIIINDEEIKNREEHDEIGQISLN